MSTFEDGSYGSLTGIKLIGKVLAGRCQMRYTRAAVGSGQIPEGFTPKTMTGPAGYVMDAMIAAVSNPVDGECQVTVQIKSDNVETGFYATNIVLFAEDPDDGEVAYTYLSLENEPEWIRPASSIVGKLATFDLIAAVGDVDAVTAVIDPEAIASVKYVDQIAAQKADLTLSNLSNYQKALRNLGGRPSRNLLDNWYFAGGGSQQGGGQFPINQRGQTSYTVLNGSCIDRWKIFNSATLALEADAIALTSSNTSTYESPSQFRQILSSEVMEQIKGRTVTLSVLTTQGLFSGPFTISPDGSSISGEMISMEDWYANLYANPGISKIEFRFVSLNPNATLKIRAVKLELGPIQTLACQDEAGGWQLFETPDYGAELAKCQRYFQLYSAAGTRPAKAVDCRPVMRTDPVQSTTVIGETTYYCNNAEL